MNQTPDENNPIGSSDNRSNEPVWSYRGYQMHSGEFTTAMVHFFRAEISRANVWRQRLDTTTNWAVVSTGAAITIAFNPTSGHHAVILLTSLLVLMFLFIEARRYRYYELWSSRVRLMETDFFAAMLVPPFGPSPDWAESLAENLLQPHFPISLWEAIGRRYRRNYLWIYMILGAAWILRMIEIPTPISSWEDILVRAAVGPINGGIVIMLGILFNVFWFILGILTIGLHEASGEVLFRYGAGFNGVPDKELEGAKRGKFRPWFRHTRRRQQLLALIITDRAKQVADIVLKELRRGVTSLPGIGMYTGKEHSVLMCALTVTEVAQLKAMVKQEDANAFIIVAPVQEILGKGFVPLETE
jgi:uncharacterized membrane protein